MGKFNSDSFDLESVRLFSFDDYLVQYLQFSKPEKATKMNRFHWRMSDRFPVFQMKAAKC